METVGSHLKMSFKSSQVIGQTALACGTIAVGSCNAEVSLQLLQALLERSETQRKDTHCRFIALGIGLTYLGNVCV